LSSRAPGSHKPGAKARTTTLDNDNDDDNDDELSKLSDFVIEMMSSGWYLIRQLGGTVRASNL